MLTLLTYVIASCDQCGGFYECHDDEGSLGPVLFGGQAEAAAWIGDGGGWRAQAGGVLTCRQCVAAQDCATYGHDWAPWEPCDCDVGHGDHADGQLGNVCTYEFQLCNRCCWLEERGESSCSPVNGHQLDHVAPAGPESWEELVTAAVHEVFPMGVADVIARGDAFGALVYRVSERCQLVDATPCDVLRAIDEGDQWFAGRADEPAAFLAAKVREL